jgi:hypothetical protein
MAMLKFLIFITLMTTQTWAKGPTMIDDVIQNYFNGYQKADTVLIKKAFHSDTKLLSVSEGKLDVTEMKDWLTSLEDRQARGDIRTGKLKILSIDVTDETASVKLNIRFPKFEFTDYLSLLKIEGSWIIVGKIYHYQPITDQNL